MNRLRKARLNVDKSQLQLMRETGIHYSSISRFEREWEQPSNKQKAHLADALGVEVDWLFPELPNLT